MAGQKNLLLAALMIMTAVALQHVPAVAHSLDFSQVAAKSTSGATLKGRWRVKFVVSGLEKNLIFDANAAGSGAFQLLDTRPEDKPERSVVPASWSQLTNNRVSFSGEAELPIGTCCREIGTLIFKGTFVSQNAISGRLIFVTSISEEESPYRFRSVVGTFTASRVS